MSITPENLSDAVRDAIDAALSDAKISNEEHAKIIAAMVKDGVLDEVETRVATKFTEMALNDAKTKADKDEILNRWKATAPVAVFEDFMESQNKKEIAKSKHNAIVQVLWIISFLFLTLLSVLGISVP